VKRGKPCPLVAGDKGNFCLLPSARRSPSSAFSLIEIIITVALLSVIMLGLLLMFNQTQRAFQAGVTQVDVLESGRAAISMLSRELQQVSPTYWSPSNTLPNGLVFPRPNFACGDSLRLAGDPAFFPFGQPVPQSPNLRRTNYLHELFYVLRENRKWIGVGYFTRVETSDFQRLRLPTMNFGGQELGAGTLYRYQKEIPVNQDPFLLYSNFNAFRNDRAIRTIDPRFSTNVSRLIDGVVHFKITPYNTLGQWLTNDLANIKATNQWADGGYFFLSNAVPASVEIELSVLEDRVWQRYKAINDTPAESQARYLYLSNNVGRIHLFRQRVALRDLDPTAYQ
jgi:type II secretory pathway pseudopilin PulG